MEPKAVDKRKVIYETGQSFRYETEEILSTSLHCHAEYELIYIVDGHGKEFLGDSVREYHAGDLVLIGKNLPHLYLAENSTSEENLCSILQFPEDLFPSNMGDIQEYSMVNKLLHLSSQGVYFKSPHLKKSALEMLDLLATRKHIDRLLTLIKLLDTLGRSTNVEILSTLKYHNPLSDFMSDDPLSKIYSYLINNHREELSIGDVAEYIHMNPSSLCRYFRQKTGKTIVQTLTEIRVECACKLLSNTALTISEILWRSGFHNQGHFNKAFRQIAGITPTEYRNSISENSI
ncbi:MAG: AraC family transcriptional regulator [Muribaculaceae bacterium]|nr:AraC family transcriptional regulator [Muribaculaceae bacterium]